MAGDDAPGSGPAYQAGVDLLVCKLEQELRRLLGEPTEFVLVISQQAETREHIQALTNSSARRAHGMLRAADQCGFDTVT